MCGYRLKFVLSLPSRIRKFVCKNMILFMLMVCGFSIVFTGVVFDLMHLWREISIASGISLIIGSCIAVYMMITTKNVAKTLYKRLDKQDEILEDIATSQKDIATSQKDIATSLKNMASSQEKLSNNITDALKRIEEKS